MCDKKSWLPTQDQELANYGIIYARMVSHLSGGSVRITSNDTADHPLANPGSLTNSTDTEVAVEDFKRIREMRTTKAIKGLKKWLWVKS
jgi:choline dehydrogenase